MTIIARLIRILKVIGSMELLRRNQTQRTRNLSQRTPFELPAHPSASSAKTSVPSALKSNRGIQNCDPRVIHRKETTQSFQCRAPATLRSPHVRTRSSDHRSMESKEFRFASRSS